MDLGKFLEKLRNVWLLGMKIFLNRLFSRTSRVKLPKSWRSRLGFPLRDGILREFRCAIVSGSWWTPEGDQVGRTMSPTTSLRIVGCSSFKNLSTWSFTVVSWHDGSDNGIPDQNSKVCSRGIKDGYALLSHLRTTSYIPWACATFNTR